MNNCLFNLEAEVDLLGALINDNDSMCKVIDTLSLEDFYDVRNALLYKASKELYLLNKPIDTVTLSENLGQKLYKTIGITYLSTVIGSSCTSANIEAHAEIIKEKSTMRNMRRILNKFMEKSGMQDAKSADIISELQNEISNLSVKMPREDGSIMGPLQSYLDKLEKRSSLGAKDTLGISTGYRPLDRVTNGFIPKDYIVIAARPSMGKSALAINLALNAGIRGAAKVAFFSLEMGRDQIFDRSISNISDVNMKSIRSAALKDDEWEDVISACNMLQKGSIRIFDSVTSLTDIWAQCKRLKLKWGLDIVFIDYMQLIRNEKRLENRNLDVSQISRDLKLMAGELDITLVALSQLSRAPESRYDHRPMLCDLRDSGSIEQDADMVILLYRDDYYNSKSEQKGILDCIIAKNRNGDVGTVKLKWMAERQKVK